MKINFIFPVVFISTLACRLLSIVIPKKATVQPENYPGRIILGIPVDLGRGGCQCVPWLYWIWMAKSKPYFEMDSYGIYSQWNREEKALTQIREFTYQIPAELGIEFGYILKIRKAKGKRIDFCIEHPPISRGRRQPGSSFYR